MNTPTTAVYGELGRYPLYISRYLRILKYWLRLILFCSVLFCRNLHAELARLTLNTSTSRASHALITGQMCLQDHRTLEM